MSPKLKTAINVSAKIGIVFLVVGMLSLIFAIIEEEQILAFIGLGLTFWGALFIMISPRKYFDASLLSSTGLPTYKTVDRIIKNYRHKPTAYHMPPSPKDPSLPEHLKGLTEMVAFITNESEEVAPDIQELAEGKFILHKPSGVVITPPGVALLEAIERRTNTDFAKMRLQELGETLPRHFLEESALADSIELTIEDPTSIKIAVTNSIYKNLYTQENRPKSISILGCPIISAITCAIAKTTGKPTVIQEQRASPRGLQLEAIIKIKQD